MAFTFGNTSQSAFGTQNKVAGFGTAFGSTPATTASTGFGNFGTSFGSAAPAQQSAGFGTSFGTPSSAPPAFGSNTFGTPAASAAPSFGTAFGAPASSVAPSFGAGFGTQQAQPSLFGSTTTTAAPGLFGAATSAPGLFSSGNIGGGLFGSTAPTQSTSLFGGTTSTTPSLFGSTSTSSLFGQTTATQQPSLFGTGTATTGFGTGLFGGAATTSAPSLFGSNFGAATSTAGGFGNFGNVSAFGGFGTQQAGGLFGKPAVPQAVPTAQTQASKSQQVVASVYAINVFNDERDDILKKWNMLQACWGTGKGYFNGSQPPIEYDAQNPFYTFKAMGYNVIPEHDNCDGIVKFVFNKKIDEMKNQQEVLRNGIAGILGNKPNLTIEITQIKAISDNQTEVKVTVSEKGVTGNSRKIPASDLSAFLNQPTQRQQLSTVGVTSITPFITPSKAELEEYLKHPPPGIDFQMWQAAVRDNPNPKKYIPVPINGFTNLRCRLLHQEHQTGLHQAFLDKVNTDITQLKTRHSSSVAQIAELKSKFLEMQHRILRVLVKQECTRKLGIAIQPEEEMLRGRFEMIHQQLNNPKLFKGQVNELLSNVKMIAGSYKQSNPTYRLDPEAEEEIKHLLKYEQDGISNLIKIIQTDLKALNIINEGLKQSFPSIQ